MLDPKGVVASFIRMSPSKEYYRVRAEECCRMAVLVSQIDKRIHWLEAAARWLSLGRELGVLLPRKPTGFSPRSHRELNPSLTPLASTVSGLLRL
jgi:hypothetical protein